MQKPMTTTEAAAALGVSRRRVQQFCDEGRLGQRVGRDWVITAEEMREFKRKKRPTGRPKDG